MNYHAIAILSGDRKKSIVNRSESAMLAEVVIPFVSSGVISAKWGKRQQSYQVLELRIYKTDSPWRKVAGQTLDGFIGAKKPNLYNRFKAKADKALGKGAFRVFVIMPIQGEKYGSQEEQRVFKEYDDRFKNIEKVVSAYNSVAVRIDKEHPIEDLVGRIKTEIDRASYLIADLTDERPSCYYEAGYAEAKRKPTICIASKDSVVRPGTATKIHFDVHLHVNFFTNHDELREKLQSAIEKNKDKLFVQEGADQTIVSVDAPVAKKELQRTARRRR